MRSRRVRPASLACFLGAFVTVLMVCSSKPVQAADSTGHVRTLSHSNLTVWAVAFSPNGKEIASAGQDRTIKIWDIATGKKLREMQAEGIVSLSYSPDGTMLASAPGGGCKETDLRIWDPLTGKELRRCAGHPKTVYFVAFSPDSKVLASASVDHTVRLWDAHTGKEIRRLEGHTNTVLRVAISPDGKFVGSVSDDSTVRVWETATGKLLHTLAAHQGQVLAVVFSPDSQRVASGASDTQVRLWDCLTGQLVWTCTPSPGGQISSLAFSADGRTLAAGSESTHVHLIEVATGKERGQFQGHTGRVYGMALHPDGKTFGSASGDGTARLWDLTIPGCEELPSGRPIPADAFASLARSLSDSDATAAFPAVNALAALPEQSIPWLREHLKPEPAAKVPVDLAARIARLLQMLDDDDFQVREQASRELTELGDLAEKHLRKALTNKPSPEVERRVSKLLERFGDSPSPSRAMLLAIRGMEVLERIATPEAHDIIENLTKGPPDARITREAKATWDRIRKQKGSK